MRPTSLNWRRPIAWMAGAALVLGALGCGTGPALNAGYRSAPGFGARGAETEWPHKNMEESEPEWKGPKADLDRFAQVDDGLFRGAQPTDAGLAELKTKGIKTVVYLHFSEKQAAHEKTVVEGLGMRFVHIPMSWIVPPKRAQVDQWMKTATDPTQRPVFVHCQHGRDRTGALVGIYRIGVQGWSFDKAYAEMKQMGFRTFFIGLTYGVKRYANEHTVRPALAEAPAY